MERGRIDLTALESPFDLQATVESGQSYCWNRADGRDYEADAAYGGDCWYWTTVPVDGEPVVLRVRQSGDDLEWTATVADPADGEALCYRLLRLDDDLAAVREAAPDDRVVRDAFEAYWGMRLVRDPPFRTLIAFVCSTQMRVARIHAMQRSLREAYGEELTVDGRTYHAYPTPDALAGATEAELRDLGLGYRAPYVRETARMVADGEARPADARGREYEEAREYLTRFVGVGEKVADCVLLFSLEYLEAVPLDTWIRSTIGEFFPDCEGESYAETSRAIREALGGRYAGYVQTYLFHYLRNDRASPRAATA